MQVERANRKNVHNRADGRRQRQIVQRERDRMVVSVLENPEYGCYSRVEEELGMSYLYCFVNRFTT
jgi:hypothetical protein